ncbi:serine/threonine-protein kinase [Roseomonas harenae]|uniref:serine/threonine-protein kinase n=1 Tax=Muricoccus harenae TaxID=2692566 RepID=UPI0013314D29|nr:serine/threonine-protein kinase [Roseomonas harenae]
MNETGTEPRRIGRYVVEGEIGRGAMGLIFKARDPAIGRIVAIKLVSTELLDSAERADFLRRFEHEVQAAGRCSHPNIVAVHDYALHEGHPFLVMEYVEGTSLKEALRGGLRPSIPEAAALVQPILAALACAHANGVVHRDIKPANILLARNGATKVADFGISRIEGSDVTQVGDVVGTPNYMSPEQCLGEPVDGRADLFSTGVLLFELLAGRRAFDGRSQIEVTRKILDGPPPSLPDNVLAAAPGLAQVIGRSLARNREDRFPSADAMAAALRAGLDAPPDDGTVLAPRPAPIFARPFTPLSPQAFDEGTLGRLARRLAPYVGPIAPRLVASAARGAGSLEALCDSLALNIGEETERRRFRQEAQRETEASRAGSMAGPPSVSRAAPATASPTPASLPPETLAAATAALLPHLGPISRILVQREAASAATAEELWNRLAERIAEPAERATFLRKRTA